MINLQQNRIIKRTIKVMEEDIKLPIGYTIHKAKYIGNKEIELILEFYNHPSRSLLGLKLVLTQEVVNVMVDDYFDYSIQSIDQFNSHSEIPIENEDQLFDDLVTEKDD
jgi:hypothetical protein